MCLFPAEKKKAKAKERKDVTEMSNEATRAKIYTQHVPLSQSSELEIFFCFDWTDITTPESDETQFLRSLRNVEMRQPESMSLRKLVREGSSCNQGVI